MRIREPLAALICLTLRSHLVVELRIRHVFAVPFRLAGIERGIVPAPDDQELGLCLPQPRLPLGLNRPFLSE